MAGQAHGPKIDELMRLTATLEERMHNVRKEVEGIHNEQDSLFDAHKVLDTKVAVIEERLNEFKRTIEEAGRRRASFLPPLLAVLVGSALTVVTQLIIAYFRGTPGN
jgi:hypothetical protein